MKNYDEAITFFKESVIGYTKSGSVHGMGLSNYGMGDAYYDLNDLDKAETYLDNAKYLFEKSEAFTRLGDTELRLGDIKVKKKKNAEAKGYYTSALTHFTKINNSKKIKIAKEKLGKMN